MIIPFFPYAVSKFVVNNLTVPRILAFFVTVAYMFARVYIPAIDHIISPFIAIPGLVLIGGLIGFFLKKRGRCLNCTMSPELRHGIELMNESIGFLRGLDARGSG